MCNWTLLFFEKIKYKKLYKKSLINFIGKALRKIIYALLYICSKFFKIEIKRNILYIIANKYLRGTKYKLIAFHTIFPIIKIIYDNLF